jgi:hypothetical protein
MNQRTFFNTYLSDLQFGRVQDIPPITIEGDLDLEDCQIMALPDNLTITGCFNLKKNAILNLPKNLKCPILRLESNPIQTIVLDSQSRMEVYLDNRYYDFNLSNCREGTIVLCNSNKLNLQLEYLDKILFAWDNYSGLQGFVNSTISKFINWGEIRSKVFLSAWLEYRKLKRNKNGFSKVLKESWQKILVNEKIKHLLKIPMRFRNCVNQGFEIKRRLLKYVDEYHGNNIIKKTTKTFATKCYGMSRRYSYNVLDINDLIKSPQMQRIFKLYNILEE